MGFKSSLAQRNFNWSGVQIGNINHIPTLLRNGISWFGLGAQRPYLGEHLEAFERLTEAGIRHVHIDSTCAEDIYHPEIRFWHGRDHFDPAAQDVYMRAIASRVPDDTLFMLRIACYAPPWWTAAHPDDLQVYANGSVERELQACGKKMLPSLASPTWRADICGALAAYLDWLEDSGWSRRVSALFLCHGITWEGAILGTDGLPDYGFHAVQYFRSWLASKYHTDSALSAAWGRQVSINEASIPSPERRMRPCNVGELRCVPEDQDVIDHQQSLSDMNADVLLSLAQTARERTQGKVLIGTFYGYTLTAREQTLFTGRYGAGGFLGGHHALGRVLRSSHIDFLGSPFNYADRTLGTGLILEHVPLASIQVHGKAFFDENDLYMHSGRPSEDTRLQSNLSVGYAENLDESVRYIRLAMMQAVIRGKHQWLTELSGWIGQFKENFSNPDVLNEIHRLNIILEDLVQFDRTPVTEVAYIIDESSVAHLPLNNTTFRDKVYNASVQWGHTGTPFDLLLMDDLLQQAGHHYRLVVPVCVHAPDAVDKMCQWREHQSNVQVLWSGKPGAVPPDKNEILSAMCAAGVHRYVEDDSTVWANRSMVGIHVNTAGERIIRMGRPFYGREIFRDQPVNAPVGEFIWSFQDRDVALFVESTAF